MKDLKHANQYLIQINPPENKNQLWGAWCEDLALSAFGETKQQAFYNLVQNIPEYFAIKAERTEEKMNHTTFTQDFESETYFIPAFA
jgi:hypothetical protein